MKSISLILIFLIFFASSQKEENWNLGKSKTKVEQTEKSETIFWVDTISNGKFLKIYSKPENDWQNLTAEYGNEKTKHKIDLQTDEYQLFKIPFSNKIEWITEKSFALINGCGTACKYVMIFNVDNEKPIITTIEYYPEMKYADFKTDNPSLYIAVNENYKKSPSFVIIETDSQKIDTINLPNKWIRGIGSIFSIVDKIEIKGSEIYIEQNQENGTTKRLNKTFKLE